MIIKKQFIEWEYNVRRKLHYASYGPIIGLMCPCTKNVPNTLTFVSFNKKQIQGWLIVGKANNNNVMMIYTNKRYRKRGIGLSLVKYAINNLKRDDFLVFPHDSKSKIFWKKVAEKFSGIKVSSIDRYYYDNLFAGIEPPELVDQWRSYER